MNKSLILRGALLVLAVVLFTGCRESQRAQEANSTLQISLEIDPQPAAVGDAILLVSVRDVDGQPVSEANISVRGDMNHAGMVPVLAASEEAAENGVYVVPFNWTMGGEWIVRVTVTRPDNTSVTEVFEVDVSSFADADEDSEAMGQCSIAPQPEEEDCGLPSSFELLAPVELPGN